MFHWAIIFVNHLWQVRNWPEKYSEHHSADVLAADIPGMYGRVVVVPEAK